MPWAALGRAAARAAGCWVVLVQDDAVLDRRAGRRRSDGRCTWSGPSRSLLVAYNEVGIPVEQREQTGLGRPAPVARCQIGREIVVPPAVTG